MSHDGSCFNLEPRSHSVWRWNVRSPFRLAVGDLGSRLVMFVTAVCILFLLKLKWPKNKSFNNNLSSVLSSGGVSRKSKSTYFYRTRYDYKRLISNGELVQNFVLQNIQIFSHFSFRQIFLTVSFCYVCWHTPAHVQLTLWILKTHNTVFNPKIDFPKIRHKNVEHFKWVHAHKPKFRLFLAFVRFKLFSCPFPLLFLGPFTLATFCVSYPFWLSQKVGC